MPPPLILDPGQFPDQPIYSLEEIQKHNPQRFEMSQLSAITLMDAEKKVAVGYKDVRDDEFWVRGHMPGFPLLPGVLMCEAGAQLCSFYCRNCGLDAGDFIGFGGIDKARFRGAVKPGDRLWIVGRTDKHSNRRMVFEIQQFVESTMVFSGEIIGVPISNPQK